jgi:hygromycin-B 7''-O-kinase
MAKDFYIQRHLPDPVLDPETVLALARRHVPAAREVRTVDETGGEARAYAIDADLILKTQRPQQLRPRTSLAKEVFFLQQLENVPGVSVPRVLGYGRENRWLEYILMTRMPGVAAGALALEGEARRALLSDVGEMLRCIHSLPQEPFYRSRLFPGDHSPVDVRWRLGNLVDETAEMLHARQRSWTYPLSPEEAGRLAMEALPEVDEWVALHSNPGPEHVFVDPTSKQLTGLIDFGDAYFSHPSLDLRRWHAPADRQAILAGYLRPGPVSENFMGAWRLAMILADITAIALAPEHAKAASEELHQLLM